MRYEQHSAQKDYDKLYYLLKDIGLTESYISKLRKDSSFLLVNDCPANMRSKVKTNDIVKIALDVGSKTEIKHCDIPLDIVYEDDWLLVINKPPLISSVPNKSHYDNNLAGAVCKYMENQNPNFVFRILNRLDKDTSGLVIIAKNLYSYNNIKEIEKVYEAICHGKIDKKVKINKPILTEVENNINKMKRVISPLGKEAITFVEPILFNDNYSHVRLKLIHGRTHQIRVHLSSIGNCLVGDIIYGKKSELINHTALVCKELSFIHPKTNKKISLIANYSESFQNLLEQISR